MGLEPDCRALARGCVTSYVTLRSCLTSHASLSLCLNEGNYCLPLFGYSEHSWSKYIKTLRTSAWHAVSGMKELDIVIKEGGARRRQVEGGTKVTFLLF